MAAETTEAPQTAPARETTTIPQAASARAALRSFVLENNPGMDVEALRDDTPLIKDRLVTSLHLVDMLLLLESLRQAPIDVRRMSPASFGSIDSIVRTFVDRDN